MAGTSAISSETHAFHCLSCCVRSSNTVKELMVGFVEVQMGKEKTLGIAKGTKREQERAHTKVQARDKPYQRQYRGHVAQEHGLWHASFMPWFVAQLAGASLACYVHYLSSIIAP